MILNGLIVIAYAVLFIASIWLAWRQGKTFPFSESIMVLLIVGVGFTGLVYLATLFLHTLPMQFDISSGELTFVISYVILVAILLVFKRTPEQWNGQFLKKKTADLLFKLAIFVGVPILALRMFWASSWESLGFSMGDAQGQLLAAVLLILFFGGFNLLVGSAAKPIRERRFSAKQAALGFGVALLWNILETGLVEEFFFRAFLQTRLIAALNSPLAGICLASLLFGLAHAPGIYLRKGDKSGPLGESPSLLNSILYTIVVLSPAGWFTGLLYWKTQSLLAPISRPCSYGCGCAHG
ncbi:MAG: CPBP family intramembrane metalloprotease [Chloroflexi bacterium]|nr:CPBP family intramembrane metalloprotease [Chloroflexota bacterium]